MKIKKVSQFLWAFLAAMLVIGLYPCSVSADLTNEFIEQNEASKKQVEQEKKALNAGLSNVKQLLQNLESAKGDLENYITELDKNLDTINQNEESIKKQIQAKEEEIAATKQSLDEAQEIADAQYEAMKKRIKYMYEKGNTPYVEMLVSSSSFSDFLNKTEFIQKLSRYDREMLEEYTATRDTIAEKKAQLEKEEEELNKAHSNLQNEEEAMEALIADKEEQIGAYEADINNKEAAVKEYQAMIAAQDAIIRELEAAILAEKKRLIEENAQANTYDGGQFAWPAPSYKRISDDYGNRIHPTLGVQQFHNGIDMAAPAGSPILAAYDGTVVASAYSSTMGNYCMIDHGDGLVTIYMHASSIGVSKGQNVVRGEQIGGVGTTGRSTGNHLHFSVRKDGSYVSPWSYLR